MARRLRSRHYGGTLALLVAAATASTALDASLSPGAGNVTAACWVKGTAQTTTTEVLELVNATSADGLSVSVSAGSLIAKVRGGTAASVAAAVVLNGSWHRVTASCDASTKTVVLYVDGVQVATSGAAAWAGSFPATCKLVLGLGSVGNSALTTQGDAVLDVGHAWSALDVAADYLDGVQPATYTHRWPLDDGAGSTARATRGGLALTLSGGAAFAADSPMLGRGAVRNLCARSSRIDLAPWGMGGGATTTAFAGSVPTAIDGMVTLITAAGSYLIQTIATGVAKSNRIYIQSFYVTKVSGTDWCYLSNDQGTAGAWFNLATGVKGSASGSMLFSETEATSVAGVYRVWIGYSSNTITTPNFIALQVSANGSTSAIAAGQMAAGGAQFEEAYPGQTTPSPYVPTGAAPLSVYGARDWRQNAMTQTADLANAAWTKMANVIVSAPTFADPEGGTRANQIDLTTAVSQAGVYQTTSGIIPKGANALANVWLRADVAGNVDLRDPVTGYGATIAATTAWQLYAVAWQNAAGSGTTGLRINKSASGAASVVYAYKPRLTQWNGSVVATGAIVNAVADYIPATSAPANSSGAPRSQAL
jgi:hypothetical protein